MGVSGRVSHAAGKKHSDIATARKSGTGAMFFQSKTWTAEDVTKKVVDTKSSTIESLVVPAGASRAEIL